MEYVPVQKSDLVGYMSDCGSSDEDVKTISSKLNGISFQYFKPVHQCEIILLFLFMYQGDSIRHQQGQDAI